MTGTEIFYTALDLCGLRKENGSVPSDAGDLSQRALGLLNILLAENSSLDARIRKEEHEVISISTLSDTVDVTDIVAAAVLPYGLARLMMLGEDDEFADRMKILYDNARNTALRFGKATVGGIEEVYG